MGALEGPRAPPTSQLGTSKGTVMTEDTNAHESRGEEEKQVISGSQIKDNFLLHNNGKGQGFCLSTDSWSSNSSGPNTGSGLRACQKK